MELILLQDVDKLGRKGSVIRVRDGYARNFLLPRKLGLPATRTNQKFVAEQKERAAKRFARDKAQAEETAAKLAKLTLKIEAASGEKDKLFGSVTAEDIRQALAGHGYVFDKKKIRLPEPIRTLGSHEVGLEIFPTVKINVKIDVVRQA